MRPKTTRTQREMRKLRQVTKVSYTCAPSRYVLKYGGLKSDGIRILHISFKSILITLTGALLIGWLNTFTMSSDYSRINFNALFYFKTSNYWFVFSLCLHSENFEAFFIFAIISSLTKKCSRTVKLFKATRSIYA